MNIEAKWDHYIIGIMDKNLAIFILTFLCIVFFIADVIMMSMIWYENRRTEIDSNSMV